MSASSFRARFTIWRIDKYHRNSILIPNGVANLQAGRRRSPCSISTASRRHRYVIQVSRLVPEKRQLDLITAFKAAGCRAGS